MSSAIEVLKLLLFEKQNEAQEAESDHLYYIALEQQEAIKKALLALEQKEKLKVWLEKEIEKEQVKYKIWSNDGEYNEAICSSARLIILKEVLALCEVQGELK